jgi:anion-transporting  ArsA/GET3 family ATPase
MSSRPFYAVADRILGARFLADIAEFFILFQSMYNGFVERARAVDRTLHDARTTFVVVTTLEPGPAQEAATFGTELTRRGFPLGALVFNRVLPGWFADVDAQHSAELLAHDADAIAAKVKVARTDPALVARVLAEVGESFANYRLVAGREAELAARLGRRADLTVSVPHLSQDVADLGGLLELGASLWDGGG